MNDPMLSELLLSLADDELVLGHRDAEWTGHAPILEEDMALSNIAQDEIGHSLVWFSLLEELSGQTPDWMGFHRPWQEFRCCRLVAYPIGDFAYTLVRQYLFDEAEQVRLATLTESSHRPLQEAAGRILKEDQFHLLHTRGLVERLGDATEESHRRMQQAVTDAVPQAFGIFEPLVHEADLAAARILPAQAVLRDRWMTRIEPVLASAALTMPAPVRADDGGRRGEHTTHLQSLVRDLQSVVRSQPEARW
jgi:ring-1,2-phenylacetyl-CoA epoxidase subunit PaaC